MQKITPFLWFNGQAEEAANFYVSVFGQQSRIVSANPMSVVFELRGQEFYALNGGPQFKFTEALSLFIKCADQEEIDYFWTRLTADGGEESMCGWLKDKYGLSWQVVPQELGTLLAQSPKVGEALLKMRKLDLQALREAANS